MVDRLAVVGGQNQEKARSDCLLVKRPVTYDVAKSTPSNWQNVRLGDVLRLEYGVSLPEKHRIPGAIPVFGSAGVVGYHEKATCSGPGIIVGRKGSIGSVVWTDVDFVPIDTTYSVVPLDSRIDLRLAFYLLARQDLSRLNSATGVPGLNRVDVYALRILLPPLAEQRAIAAVLDGIDGAIERTDDVIAVTERLRDALLHELLTRGVPGWHSSWNYEPVLGTVPASWEVVRLGDVADVAFSSVDKKSTEGEEAVRLCNYTDVFYNRRISSGMSLMTATANDIERNRWALKEGDVLFTKDSETPDEIGIPAYVTEDMPDVLCGYHLGRARPMENSLVGSFLAEVLGSTQLAKQFGRSANGVTRFGLTLSSTIAIKLPLPPLEEQQVIARMLDAVDQALERAREERSGLQALKASASDALLTGRVRVGIL